MPFIQSAFLLRTKSARFFEESRLQENFQLTGNVSGYLRGRAACIDRQLLTLFSHASLPKDLSLVAVGGYGRAELCPHSDIDLLFLLQSAPNEKEAEDLANFVQNLWDIGLKVGHSVRTRSECLLASERDLSIQTALLEARFLTGDRLLFEDFQRVFLESLNPSAFFQKKRMEEEQRHLKHADILGNLEPNCKEGPGGLRDLQTMLWVARALRLGGSWHALQEKGVISPQEAVGLRRRMRFLQEIRIRLHFLVGRSSDRLRFDDQTLLASQMGFVNTPTRRASELFMQQYDRTIKFIFQCNAIFLQTMAALVFSDQEQKAVRMNLHFQKRGELLDIVSDEVFQKEPHTIFEAFLHLQNKGLKGLTARAMRALFRARKRIHDDFRNDVVNKANFLKIFQSDAHVVRELSRMNQFDILGRYLPAFGAIVGQMQHDLFHIHTVDQHTLLTLRYVRHFLDEKYAHESPLCTQVMSEITHTRALYLAALFHDIAKGRGGHHADLGRIEAERFCTAHHLPKTEASLVTWLVATHLLMSQVAQKQDIADPSVIDRFAKTVGNEEKLALLYLLTVADMRATSPKVWNAWKAELLERLFLATRAFLREGRRPLPTQGIVEVRKKEARVLLGDAPFQESLWQLFDTVYFLRHTPQEIAWHLSVLGAAQDRYERQVALRALPSQQALELMVYTPDEKDLFIRIVAFLSSRALNILDAKIHTTQKGYALDSFVIAHWQSTQVFLKDEMASLASALKERLITKPAFDQPAALLPSRQVTHFPLIPEVTVEPDASGKSYHLQVIASDKPGLLYTIAQTLSDHQVTLHTAKISTMGARVEDTFLISGQTLLSPKSRQELEAALFAQMR